MEKTTVELETLLKKTKMPLLVELKVKNVVIERLKANEKNIIQKLESLRDILKSPYMYQEFQVAYQRLLT